MEENDPVSPNDVDVDHPTPSQLAGFPTTAAVHPGSTLVPSAQGADGASCQGGDASTSAAASADRPPNTATPDYAICGAASNPLQGAPQVLPMVSAAGIAGPPVIAAPGAPPLPPGCAEFGPPVAVLSAVPPGSPQQPFFLNGPSHPTSPAMLPAMMGMVGGSCAVTGGDYGAAMAAQCTMMAPHGAVPHPMNAAAPAGRTPIVMPTAFHGPAMARMPSMMVGTRGMGNYVGSSSPSHRGRTGDSLGTSMSWTRGAIFGQVTASLHAHVRTGTKHTRASSLVALVHLRIVCASCMHSCSCLSARHCSSLHVAGCRGVLTRHA